MFQILPCLLGNFDKTPVSYTHLDVYKRQEQRPSIAYFSMEYGLSSVLKIYSGGLGVLAGDYLKAILFGSLLPETTPT